MMPDRPLITLTLTHGYHHPAEPPVRLAIPRGMAVRRVGGRHAVILPDRQDPPDQVSLTLMWESVDFCMITKGYDWGAVPVLDVQAGLDDLTFGGEPPRSTEMRGPGDRRIAQLDIAITDGAARDIHLGFDAVAPLWTYHLTGRGLRDDVQIVDTGNAVRFDDLGVQPLPSGAPARVLRSTEPLALRARPTQRFALQYEGRFGPVVLVPVLPAAGAKTRPIVEDGAAGRLQSDIYVTLS